MIKIVLLDPINSYQLKKDFICKADLKIIVSSKRLFIGNPLDLQLL
jgi:hypothetical protein